MATVGDHLMRGDEARGIDHAAWAMMKFLNPVEDIPVLELSLDMERPPQYHYELGKKLKPLREKGIMVIGSGNIVHNLTMINFNENATPYLWAVEFDNEVKERILEDDHRTLIEYGKPENLPRKAFPTLDHYLPLLYTLAMKEPGENVSFFHEGLQNGSVSMRCVRIN